LNRRALALVALLALGVLAGAILEAITGSQASYLAIPAVVAAGWLFVANPHACAGLQSDSQSDCKKVKEQ
jgi:hypothetical protein